VCARILEKGEDASTRRQAVKTNLVKGMIKIKGMMKVEFLLEGSHAQPSRRAHKLRNMACSGPPVPKQKGTGMNRRPFLVVGMVAIVKASNRNLVN
jgi:hypothetical protein